MSGGQRGEKDGFWEESLEIHSYDVDVSMRLTAESLLKYFQEAAWNHAEHLGLGYSHLRSRNQVWVLSRMMLVADSYPEWGQSVLLRTWPRGAMSLFALRDFELRNADGDRLLGATSAWLVLDLQSRRPQRIEPIIARIREFPDCRALKMETARLVAVADGPAPTALDVRYGDLDLNDHVNNATYVRWILDSYPAAFHRSHRLRSLAINFLAEVGADDSVLLDRVETEDLRIAHTIRRRIDGTDACRAELVWEEL